MKKQNNAKARREAEENRRNGALQSYKDADRAKADAERARKREEEEKAEAERQAREAARKAEQESQWVGSRKYSFDAAKQSDIRKKEEAERKAHEEALKAAQKPRSRAKAAGVNSTFKLDNDTVLMTTYGKRNLALREKQINGDTVTPLNDPERLSVRQQNPKKYNVTGFSGIRATSYNPTTCGYHRTLPDGRQSKDLICCSDKLELAYFGREFDDNIHIQIIYSILDIEKILTIHVNNVVFELDNMLRREGIDFNDFVGYMSLRYEYTKFMNAKAGTNRAEARDLFNELLSKPQLRYFGDILLMEDAKHKPLKEGTDEYKKRHRECYDIVATIGTMRQATAHGDIGNRRSLYAFDKKKPETSDEWIPGRQMLDKLYRSRVEQLNKNFINTSKVDLLILFRAFNAEGVVEKQRRITHDYYDFIVKKTVKNMGFSIKKLRETILEYPDAQLLKDETYDTVRSRLYRSIDFVLYEYYSADEDRTEALINKLRSSLTEVEKQGYYVEEAKTCWRDCKSIIMGHLAQSIKGDRIKEIRKQPLNAGLMGSLDTIPVSAHGFTEMIYLLTNFLDGKEINDLLTTLIHKFESIASFLDVIEKQDPDGEKGLNVPFQPDYAIFNESQVISQELRSVNSFARMSKESPDAKDVMFIEAAQLLGSEATDEELTPYMKEKSNHPFRNFIMNNVVESDRFKYLVRYGVPKKIRKLAVNRAVVSFVMKDIPEAQILRYYNSFSTADKLKEYMPKMRDILTDAIVGLKFDDFKKVKTQSNNPDKESKKTLIRLYLTVVYLLQKNLVYANSRYFLAFQCAARDGMIFDSTTYDVENNKNVARAQFARDFLDDKEHHPQKRRVVAYLNQNFTNTNSWCVTSFRNCVEHLNAVRNASEFIGDIKQFSTYFELYHYLVQRSLMQQLEYELKKADRDLTKQSEEYLKLKNASFEGNIRRYMGLVAGHRTYCKDFVKAYCIAFSYNLPRYKNLTINELFDMNNYMPGKSKESEKHRDSVDGVTPYLYELYGE